MVAPIQADRRQVLAFRLASHNLARRLPPGSLLEAVGACGIQDSPPGSAALALSARVLDLTMGDVDQALEADKSLLQIRSMRTAPHLVPTRDVTVFTAGLLPDDACSWSHSSAPASPLPSPRLPREGGNRAYLVVGKGNGFPLARELPMFFGHHRT